MNVKSHEASGMPIRTLLRRLGITAAILVALLSPLVYWHQRVAAETEALEFKAHLNAGRIARLVFTSDQMWRYQAVRISELIDLGTAQVAPIQQVVRDMKGESIVTVGQPISWPSLAVTAPVSVRGTQVAELRLETSLQPTALATSYVLVLSALLGIGCLWVLSWFPLQVLDETLGELEQAEQEARTANEELRVLNANLERVVEERTAAAEEAAEEARVANKVKSAFLASMSHEIRTPMNGVLGMADLLGRTELNDHQRRLLSTIDQSARTLLLIINDILDHSRIEAGKLELDIHEFDLRECVESAVELMSEEAARKSIEISLLMPPSLPRFVFGDPGRLRQVLVNIIGNAVKFTSRGGVIIRVGAQTRDDATAELRFSIADTGIGMDEKTQALLFKPFSQGDSTISRRFGGTGLGLTIANDLIALMRGELRLESQLGKGTTVSFAIPLDVSANVPAPREDCVHVIEGRRVLVVDDREINREILVCYLRDCRASVDSASSGEEALSLLRQREAEGGPFELVVLDMVLPGINGIEVARRIRSDSAFGSPRLLLVTSMNWHGDQSLARSVGFNGYLNKPIRRDDLLANVRACLKAPAPSQSQDLSAGDGQRAVAKSLRRFDGVRVLIAEDNPVNQAVAQEYCSTLGCQVVVAEDGVRALTAFERGAYDVVLMDCQMPEMDGYAACRRIREIEHVKEIARVPVIAVTANAYASDRATCLAAGMDDFLPKPFTIAQLEAVLAKWLPDKVLAPSSISLVIPTQSKGDAAEAGEALDFDPQVLAEVEQQQAGMAARFAELFLATAPKSIEQIRNGLSEESRDKVRSAAHSLKSACAYIGAMQASRLAASLERMANESTSIEDMLHKASQLEHAFDRAAMELKLITVPAGECITKRA